MFFNSDVHVRQSISNFLYRTHMLVRLQAVDSLRARSKVAGWFSRFFWIFSG